MSSRHGANSTKEGRRQCLNSVLLISTIRQAGRGRSRQSWRQGTGESSSENQARRLDQVEAQVGLEMGERGQLKGSLAPRSHQYTYQLRDRILRGRCNRQRTFVYSRHFLTPTGRKYPVSVPPEGTVCQQSVEEREEAVLSTANRSLGARTGYEALQPERAKESKDSSKQARGSTWQG
jgi:hypothetical protein